MNISNRSPAKATFFSQFEDFCTRISKEYDSTKENLIIEIGKLNKEDKRYLRELEFHLTLTLIRVKEIFEKEGILPNDQHLELTYAPSGV